MVRLLSTDLGFVRLREDRSDSPSWWEHEAFKVSGLMERFWSGQAGLLDELRVFGAVEMHDIPTVCYAPSLHGHWITGDSAIHGAGPNIELASALAKVSHRWHRLLAKRTLLRMICKALVIQRLPTPTQALQELKSKGIVVLNRRQYKIYVSCSSYTAEWELEWPDPDFVLEL